MYLDEISDDLLISLYREGIQWAIDLLFERYGVFLYGFINKILRSQNIHCDYKEAFQELFVVLINCIDRYDEYAGCFYFFVKCSVERRLFNLVNQLNKDKKIASLDELCFSSGNESYLDYIEETDNRMYYETELYKKMEEKLDDRALMIVNMKVEGFTYQEIADSLGVNKQSIYRKMVTVKNIIKDIIKN